MVGLHLASTKCFHTIEITVTIDKSPQIEREKCRGATYHVQDNKYTTETHFIRKQKCGV